MRLFFAFCLLAFVALSARAQEKVAPSIQVFVNRSDVPLTGPDLVIPHDAIQLRFLVTPKPGQVRYKLEGLEKDWNQRVGLMYFGVRFYNAKNDLLSQELFVASGRSPGWAGSLEKSRFTGRKETVTVPPDAARVEFFMSSAGPAACIGIFAITDISLSWADLARPSEMIFSRKPSAVSETPGSLDTLWKKGGTHPSMAQISNLSDSDGPFQCLALYDQDIKAHADWYSTQKIPVLPGQKLILQWNEAYSNGMGDPLWATYGGLPAGSYQFKVEEVSLSGNPLKMEYSLLLRVPLPFWKNPWFAVACSAFAIALGIFVSHRFVQANARRQMKQARLIEEERMRIARDLHDDLGARLSQISLASSHAGDLAPTKESKESFQSITSMSRELTTSLSETVWMLNPKNDHLESLVDFLCRLVSNQCRPSGISCRLETQAVIENCTIRGDIRHNICLAVREATTNALRHSQASEVRLKIDFRNQLLRIVVVDNGQGLSEKDQPSLTGGNGLENMKQRMAHLHGSFSIKSSKEGTSVCFEIPIT